jgi:small subunit ribosomal protein S20
MPIKKSAKKYLSASLKRKAQNSSIKKTFRLAIKKTRELVKDAKVDEAKDSLKAAMKAIDKAAKSNVIQKNNAARKKSRLAKMINKASAK